MSKITEFLKSLGDDADKVFLTLYRLGCTGKRHVSDACPVAKAIYKYFPSCKGDLLVNTIERPAGFMKFGCYGHMWVDSKKYVEITWDDPQVMDPSVPKAIEQFVFNFDAGKYPELEE